MAARSKRGRAGGPLETLAALREEAERVELALATANGELATIRVALARIPERARAAHVREALQRGDGETVAAVRAEELELRGREDELRTRAEALGGEYRRAERAIAEHYAEHLEVFARLADERTEEAVAARDRVIAAVHEAVAAWREATSLWSPVVSAFRATEPGVSINAPTPPPYDAVLYEVTRWAHLAPRPSQVAPGGVLPTREMPWPGAFAEEAAA